MKTVLVTGGNGRMGRCISEGLRKAGYDVRSTSRTPNEELGVTHLDVRDAEACVEALKGVDTVIHMAFYLPWDKFREEQVPINIIGTWNMYEAAVKNGVKRFIFGSSNHSVGFYRQDDELRDDIMHRPDSPYGLSKSFAELCGRYYSDRFGISVINVRIGSFYPEGVLPSAPRRCRTWLSPRDCRQLFQKCVEADESIRFLTIYGTSGNSKTDFDISRLKDQLGYEPEDDGLDHLEYAKTATPRIRHYTPNPYGNDKEFNFKGYDAILYNHLINNFAWEDLDELEERHGKK